MITPKLVSFIIPVYNAEHSLFPCVQSILGQMYHPIEIILINDGSTDHSKDLCNKLAEVYASIHVIHQENTGVSQARNRGIREANGEYIQFVDADDYIDSMMTKKLVQAMKSNKKCELVICGYEAITTKTSRKKYTPCIEGMLKNNRYLTHIGELYKQIILPSPCNKLYRTDIIREHQLSFTDKLSNGEDLLFNLDYLRHCKHIHIIGDTLYKYLMKDSYSLSRRYRKDYLQEQQRLLEEVTRFLREKRALTTKNQQVIGEIYANSIINALTNLFHPDNSMPRNRKKEQMDDILLTAKRNVDMKYFRGTSQKRLVSMLIRLRATYGLYAFFRVKPFLQHQQRVLSTIVKKVKHE
ncbi:glycosyltransferase family 2 protein [Virgibacillus salexigens]|uniref:Putative glycosyltransferase EpsJ n=1 Tax=Virgibacillus massiliensis TaxID=1462526 RepID=A0A024Q851_9BACI|nr:MULTISPECIES: glycosyltransferase [Virgibacillus]CDQ38380.1 putative glycosyltransferase EpsJ [Virgibacillus massiliensis]